MKLPASQALHAYWSSLRQGRLLPERNDLDPTAMRHLLTQTFVLEVDARTPLDLRLPIRVSGTRLDALFGRDLKQSAFIGLWDEGSRALVRAIADGVLAESRPALIGGHAAPRGAAPLGFELLLLPLRHLGRTHARMLGGLAVAGTPDWLGLEPVRPLQPTTWRMLDDAATTRGALPAWGEAPAEPEHRRAHLVVHQGGRAADVPAAPGRQARVNSPLSRWVSRR